MTLVNYIHGFGCLDLTFAYTHKVEVIFIYPSRYSTQPRSRTHCQTIWVANVHIFKTQHTKQKHKHTDIDMYIHS